MEGGREKERGRKRDAEEKGREGEGKKRRRE